MKNKLLLKFLLFFNRSLKNRGQNAFAKKSDVKFLISEVAYKWKDSPVATGRFRELLDAIEELKI